MTPAEETAAVTDTNNRILAACPVFDHATGAKVDKTGALAKIAHDIRLSLREGATPAQIADSVVNTIKSCVRFTMPDGTTSYDAGYAGDGIGGEGYTSLPSQFAPKGTARPGLSDAQKRTNALQTANVQQARDGKPFLGLDGAAYEPGRTGYDAAAQALLAASPAQPAPVYGPPFGVGKYAGPERRVGPQHVRSNDSGAVSTGGTIKPGSGIA